MSSKKTSSSSRRLYGVLLHPCSGKTALANSVHGKKGRKNVVFVDVDANVKYEPGQTSIDFFPKIKESVDKAYREYSKYKIVIISSNQQLFEFLKITKSRVFAYVPDDFLFLNMLVDRGLLDTPIPGSELDKQPEMNKNDDEDDTVTRKRSGTGTRKRSGTGTAYSLGKEQNKTQSEVDSSDDIVELYNREIRSILESRKALLSRKHSKYTSLDGLVKGVFASILKQREV